VYVNDSAPGIQRRRAGKGFVFFGPTGRRLRNATVLRRIRSLAIPPAWEKVWICARAEGHIQAVGRDARGRKQYRYHPRWREMREEDKYQRMVAFGAALPRIRLRVTRDLARIGMPRRKVLATVVRILQATHMRVGNEEYARQNQSFGLTTLRDRHVRVSGGRVRFRYRGKSRKLRIVELSDARLARIIRRCRELPGQDLFRYVDEDGRLQPIGSGDVNEYLRDISGEDFTAKDFRTWGGTVLAARLLRELEPCRTKTQARRNVVRAIDLVAARLGNTRAVCRKSYVHPQVVDAYLDGRVVPKSVNRACGSRGTGLRADERALLGLLRSARRRRRRSRAPSSS
jgi:DNA topoisomerase-1